MSERKTYLGDGAYAELDQYGDLILTTEDGISITNRIVLGGAEYQALVDFVNRLCEEQVERELADGACSPRLR